MVIAASAGAWIAQRGHRDIDPQQIIATHLSRAQAAYDRGILVSPADSSALQAYRIVLAIDPVQPDATRGVDRIADRLLADATRFIDAERLGPALQALQGARRARPDHPRLSVIEARLDGALQARLQQQAAVPEAATASLR
jgi:hypothetical protein